MTPSPTPPISPVVRHLAVALAVCTLFPLLVLGGLTSSTRSGMADPVWPTEPWFMLVNGQKFIDSENGVGYLLEHSHRAAGWVVGGLASVLAFAAWVSGPDKKKRLLPLLAVFALLAFYGWFHGQMMAEGTRWGKAKAAGEVYAVAWPWASILSTLLATVAVLLAAVRQLFQRDPAKWVRFLATLVLVGTMAQGLLGGLRVFLDTQTGLKETVGVELSQIHGLFAQVVFAAMCVLPVLCGRPKVELADADRRRVLWPAVALPVAILVQLVWAVWVRHAQLPGLLGTAQRLHLLTAFVVAGLVVWLVARVALTPGAKRPLAFGTHLLSALLLVQVFLGVEAWMGKFAATGPEGQIEPTQRKKLYAEAGWVLLRTGHQLIGAGMLAASAVLAARVLRPAAVPGEPGPQGPRVPAAVAENEPVASSA